MTYTLQNSQLSVQISSLGAQLQSVCFRGQEILWQGDPTFWSERAPLLFPFCGRCRDGKYLYEGAEYPMTIHGFLSSLESRVQQNSKDSACFFFSSNEQTLSVYPFSFQVSVTYRLEETKLSMQVCVQAGENSLLPFSFGFHPGFALPSGDLSSISLKFAKSSHPVIRSIASDGLYLLPTGEEAPYPLEEGVSLPLSDSRITGNGLFLGNTCRDVFLKIPNFDFTIRLCYPDYPELGIWKAGPDAPFLCLEPWHGLPAPHGVPTDLSVKEYPDRILLQAGERKELALQLEFL